MKAIVLAALLLLAGCAKPVPDPVKACAPLPEIRVDQDVTAYIVTIVGMYGACAKGRA